MKLHLPEQPVTVVWSCGDTDVSVRVRPLSLGFARRFKERGVVPPTPPRTVSRDSGGRVLRDGNGEPVTVVDTADAAYQAAVERYHERLAVLMVAESVGEELGLEAVVPTGHAGWDGYADAVADELAAAGFTSGDLVRLCQAVCEASRLGSSDLQRAADDFFTDAAAGRSSPA